MGALQPLELLDDLLPIIRERPQDRVVTQVVGELGHAFPIARDRRPVVPRQLVQAVDQGLPDLGSRLAPVELRLNLGALAPR